MGVQTVVDIQMMQAGGEMDLLIAEKVMKYQIIDAIPYKGEGPFYYNKYFKRSLTTDPLTWEKWCPSTDIKAAWDVVEKLKALGWKMFLMNTYSHGPGIPFEYGCDLKTKDHAVIGYGPTAPLAICRAALLAVEV